MAKHVGLSGSVGPASCRNFEAAPASSSSPPPSGAASTIESINAGVINWHLRLWPEIAALVLERTQRLPVSVVRELADTLGQYLRMRAGTFADESVASGSRRLYALPVRERLGSIGKVMKAFPGVRDDVHGLCVQLQNELESAHGLSQSDAAVQTATGLFVTIGAAMLLGLEYPAEDIEDQVGW